MGNFPDFTSKGYQVIRELGTSRQGGRSTYLARRIDAADSTATQQAVIKYFQFDNATAKWSGFRAIEQEVQVLQNLDHPGIPRYLDAWELSHGFALVQEYKPAQSLATSCIWSPEQIKQIAIAVLEILQYLQEQVPPIIHRDIKPENILIDEESLQAYLVDFGIAQIGMARSQLTDTTAGTFGFMAPEQLYNDELSTATDLYGLGTTLITLLTGTPSYAIGQLFDYNSNRWQFRHLLSHLSRQWLDWLDKMVAPNPRHRFSSAAAALHALKPIAVRRTPILKIHNFPDLWQATILEEQLQRQIALTNDVPATTLQGHWTIVEHPHDPPSSKYHPWIHIQPTHFEGNEIRCQLSIDTSQLKANSTYERTLKLHTNAVEPTYTLPLRVRTASIPTGVPQLPHKWLLGLFLLVFATVGLAIASVGTVGAIALAGVGGGVVGTCFGSLSFLNPSYQNSSSIAEKIFLPIPATAISAIVVVLASWWGTGLGNLPIAILFGAISGSLSGYFAAKWGFWDFQEQSHPAASQIQFGTIIGGIAGMLAGIPIGGKLSQLAVSATDIGRLLTIGLLLAILGGAVGTALGVATRIWGYAIYQYLKQRKLPQWIAVATPVLTVGSALSLVVGWGLRSLLDITDLWLSVVWVVATASSISLVALILYFYLRRLWVVVSYRRYEQNLIEP